LKVNEFVSREVVDKLMKMANPVWQVILGLSRYPVFFTTEHTEHTEANSRTGNALLPCVPCFPWFPALRGQDQRRDRRTPSFLPPS
jgi:hypothetical protein